MKVRRCLAALVSASVSKPQAARESRKVSSARSRWTASRARAWADWNSRSARVGMLDPARPSAMRALVNLARSFQGSAGTEEDGSDIVLGLSIPCNSQQRMGRADCLQSCFAIENIHLPQPRLELWCRPQSQQLS